MRSSDFMRAIPAAVRQKLPAELQGFKSSHRSWLVQLHYGPEPRIHYELWLLTTRHQRAGARAVEVGLHFECRDASENTRLLALCERYLFEIKEALGAQVEAEPWDKGWTKIYEVVALEGFTQAYLDKVAGRLARFIEVLQPLVDPQPAARAGGRRR